LTANFELAGSAEETNRGAWKAATVSRRSYVVYSITIVISVRKQYYDRGQKECIEHNDGERDEGWVANHPPAPKHVPERSD